MHKNPPTYRVFDKVKFFANGKLLFAISQKIEEQNAHIFLRVVVLQGTGSNKFLLFAIFW